MSITYDLIIKHLCPEKPMQIAQEKPSQQKPPIYKYHVDEKTFSTKKGTHGFIKTFPPIFYEFICDKTYRYGITTHYGNTNISFWCSLLTLLDGEFLIPYKEDENTQIANFKTKILDEYPNKYIVEKSDIREKLKIEPDTIIMQYIVDTLDINFIIFNFQTEKINIMYKNKIMNPMKPTLMLANYMSLWEPIMINGDTQRYFSYNNNFIKKILSSSLIYYNDSRDVLINDNINVVIDNEVKNLTKDIKPKVDDIFIKPTAINTTKLNRMTKDKLIEHATSQGIDTPMAKMLKAQIIELILHL